MVARLNFLARTMPRRSPLHQRDARALDGHVRARAHGDAHLRLRQRRRVVDAVTGHGDDAALALQRWMASPFCSGRTSAITSSMPSCRATTSARGAVVTRQHHDAQAFASQFSDGFRAPTA